jgi:hypothetical protein
VTEFASSRGFLRPETGTPAGEKGLKEPGRRAVKGSHHHDDEPILSFVQPVVKRCREYENSPPSESAGCFGERETFHTWGFSRRKRGVVCSFFFASRELKISQSAEIVN